jgi:hypothetical protein
MSPVEDARDKLGAEPDCEGGRDGTVSCELGRSEAAPRAGEETGTVRRSRDSRSDGIITDLLSVSHPKRIGRLPWSICTMGHYEMGQLVGDC